MKFSRSPQLDFFVSLGLFCAVTIGGYFIFTMEITHPGEGLSEVQTRKSPVPKAYSQKVVQVKNSIQKSVERGPRLAANSEGKAKRVYRPRPPIVAEASDEMADSIQDMISLVDSGDWQTAEKKLLQYIQRHPNDESALVELAMIQLIDKKDAAAAKPYLERVVEGNLDNSSVLGELLAIYQETNTVDEGLKFLKGLKDKDTGSGVLDYGIGSSLLSNGRSEEAIDYLHKALDGSQVDLIIVKEDLADAYMESGRSDEAIHLFNELEEQIGSQDKRRTLIIKKASAMMDKGDEESAYQVLQEWLKDNPDDEFVQDVFRELPVD